MEEKSIIVSIGGQGSNINQCFKKFAEEMKKLREAAEQSLSEDRINLHINNLVKGGFSQQDAVEFVNQAIELGKGYNLDFLVPLTIFSKQMEQTALKLKNSIPPTLRFADPYSIESVDSVLFEKNKKPWKKKYHWE